mmetsp:Transcript_76135/g.152961  ORF Transcript_76135/g.152961 Transcript_76135/m.152961 type:complete len:431 (-) Transcript_76135:216-1508(-)
MERKARSLIVYTAAVLVLEEGLDRLQNYFPEREEVGEEGGEGVEEQGGLRSCRVEERHYFGSRRVRARLCGKEQGPKVLERAGGEQSGQLFGRGHGRQQGLYFLERRRHLQCQHVHNAHRRGRVCCPRRRSREVSLSEFERDLGAPLGEFGRHGGYHPHRHQHRLRVGRAHHDPRVLARLHRRHVLSFVQTNVEEHVVQGLHHRSPAPPRTARLELVKVVHVAAAVVLPGDGGGRQRGQQLRVRIQKFSVRVHRVRLNELREVVRVARAHQPEPHQHPEVQHGGVLREEPVAPQLVSAQALHDEQVVELVPLLGEVHPLDLCAAAPPAEALVQVEHGDVAEVRHARDRFQEPKPLDGPVFEQQVDDPAQEQVGRFQHQRRAHPAPACLPRLLPLGHRPVAQHQLVQPASSHRRRRVKPAPSLCRNRLRLW